MLGKALQIAAGQGLPFGVPAEGVDFDGTNDYLSRSSDLTGNTDGKTFTFSAWVYTNISTTGAILANNTSATNARVWFDIINAGRGLEIYLRDSSNANALLAQGMSTILTPHKWNHILVSIDLSSASNRYVYVNDVLLSPSWTTYNTALTPDFTANNWYVAGSVADINGTTTNNRHYGRLAHMYLDYTYRDLSNVANRRLFITEDLKPADNQASLSPILYLPMTDADTAHVNAGTGGDFTPVGTFATSQRGPNQYNCVASDFDGAADYIYRTANITGSDPTKITFSATFEADNISSNFKVFIISDVNDLQARAEVYISASKIHVFFNDYARTNFVTIQNNTDIAIGRQHHLCCSFDLDTQTYSARFDNKDISGSVVAVGPPTSFGIVQIDPRITIGAWKRDGGQPDSLWWNGRIGEVYLDTNYVDLTTSNPFWDDTTNRPKPVRQVIEETGNSPLIATPIEASNAGLNLGTGGNFTVNSGPFTGARGASEFWARSVFLDNPTQNEGRCLYLNNEPDVSLVQKDTLCIFFKRDDTDVTDNSCLYGVNSSTNNDAQFSLLFTASENLTLYFSGHEVFSSAPITNQNWHSVLISIDSTATVAHAYIDGVAQSASITLNRAHQHDWTQIGRYAGASNTQSFDGNIAYVYHVHDYIDFSQEANRLKFVDAFNYPIDLQPAIDAGDIPNPLVYMKFDDPSNLGLNSGTGGNFTVNGTVTQGADVDPNA